PHVSNRSPDIRTSSQKTVPAQARPRSGWRARIHSRSGGRAVRVRYAPGLPAPGYGSGTTRRPGTRRARKAVIRGRDHPEVSAGRGRWARRYSAQPRQAAAPQARAPTRTVDVLRMATPELRGPNVGRSRRTRAGADTPAAAPAAAGVPAGRPTRR